MKSWGRKLSYTKAKQVSENDEVLHGKYYVLEGSKTNFEFAWALDKEATEQRLIQEAINQFRDNPDVTLVYAEATITDGGLPGFFYDVKTTYVVKGNHPIAAAVIIAIGIAIAVVIIAVSIAVLMWHIVMNALGGNLWTLLLIFILLVGAIYLLKGGFEVGGFGVRAKVKGRT